VSPSQARTRRRAVRTSREESPRRTERRETRKHARRSRFRGGETPDRRRRGRTRRSIRSDAGRSGSRNGSGQDRGEYRVARERASDECSRCLAGHRTEYRLICRSGIRRRVHRVGTFHLRRIRSSGNRERSRIHPKSSSQARSLSRDHPTNRKRTRSRGRESQRARGPSEGDESDP